MTYPQVALDGRINKALSVSETVPISAAHSDCEERSLTAPFMFMSLVYALEMTNLIGLLPTILR